MDEHVRGRRNRSGLLWRMLVLELWHRNFMESRTQWSAERRPPDIFARETRQASPAGGGGDVRTPGSGPKLKLHDRTDSQ